MFIKFFLVSMISGERIKVGELSQLVGFDSIFFLDGRYRSRSSGKFGAILGSSQALDYLWLSFILVPKFV